MGFTLLGLTHVVNRGEQSYPAVYKGGGDSEGIDFDFTKANLYHRITGEVDIEQDDDDTSGCGIVTSENYPMVCIAYFPNNLLGTDDSYSVIKIAANIKNKLPANLTSIANSLNLHSVDVSLSSLNLDSLDVWNSEFSGVDFKVPSTHRIISITYSITLTGSQNCFTDYECE